MQKVLITGSSGHLGARALEMLRSQYEVHAIVRTKPSTAYPDVGYHEIDLSHDWSASTLPGQMDAVIHLAQSRNYRDFPAHALETFLVNTASTARLLDYACQVGARRFVLASTGGLYQSCSTVIDEKTPLDPPQGNLSYYFRTKHSAELLAESYSALLDTTVLRPFFIYGPGQSSEKLIARLITSVRDGQPVQLAGGEGLKVNPVHVDDAAELIHMLLGVSGSRILNVAGPDVVSIRQIAEEIGRATGIAPVFERMYGAGDAIVADHRPASSLLGREMTRFSDGLRSLIK